MDITEWLRRLAARRRAAFGAASLEGCRYKEAADEIARLRAALDKITKRPSQAAFIARKALDASAPTPSPADPATPQGEP